MILSSTAQNHDDEYIEVVRLAQRPANQNLSDNGEPKHRRRSSDRKRENYDLRSYKSHLYRPSVKVPKAFRTFALARILPNVKITRTRKHHKQDALIRMLYQLIRCGLTDFVVADSRDNSSAEIRARIKLWDSLEKSGFMRRCLGSKPSKKTTRYAATAKLLSIRDVWPKSLFPESRLQRNSQHSKATRHALVVIQSKATSEKKKSKRVAIDFSQFEEALDRLRASEDRIEALNDRNLRYTWCLKHTLGMSLELNPRLRMLHSDRPGNGTRLYTCGRFSIQNFSGETRRRILIDDQPTAEPDFSGSHPRLLYHKFAKQQGPDNMRGDDIYLVDTIFPALQNDIIAAMSRNELRKAVKLATNICITNSSQALAQGAVFDMLLSERLWNLVQHWLGNPSNPAAELVRRLRQAHPLVEKYFFQNRGMELMTIESGIMLEILEAVTATDRPALGIHDSVLCRQQDEEFVKQMMASVYKDRMGFSPVIKSK